tara:strand:+ start:53 stop:748 length:696 start_codon:yes stop_codon:yes gene_type:complete
MVNIDTVYQRVLLLANKEQRGYITPQEFNLFANQAQMDIFEQYFYDLNQFLKTPGNDTLYADPVTILQDKIELFHKSTTIGPGSNPFDLPSDSYRLGQVRYNNTTLGYGVDVERSSHRQFMVARNTPLGKPTLSRPAYYMKDTRIIVNPSSIDKIDINYIRRPEAVKWAYTVVQGKAIYNSTNSTNFELHDSEEVELVFKILELAGITLKDNSLYQVASTEENETIQQEKR